MLVEYQNKIYRRKELLGISFCDRCPLKSYTTDLCDIERIPYTCSVTGDITLSISEIFNL